MRIILAALLIVGTSACAMSEPKQANGAMLDCDASAAQTLVGRQKSDALAALAMKRTGTKTVRWIAPGQAVTMDYRTDRLNIEVDAQEIAIRISCG